MRQKHVIGNWKMNTVIAEGVDLAKGVVSGLPAACNAAVVIAPPFTSLSEVGAIIKNSPVRLGAQNASAHESGAHTGEISVAMLKAVGVSYIILGHSERRMLYGETNEFVNRKVLAVLSGGATVVLCIGETLEERDSGKLRTVIDEQLTCGLAGVDGSAIGNVIIAYEPVWAIGTGKSATSAQADEVHSMIRSRVTELYSEQIAQRIIILYGGSVKPENAAELIAQEHIDGFLVGGACLNADSFVRIIEA